MTAIPQITFLTSDFMSVTILNTNSASHEINQFEAFKRKSNSLIQTLDLFITSRKILLSLLPLLIFISKRVLGYG